MFGAASKVLCIYVNRYMCILTGVVDVLYPPIYPLKPKNTKWLVTVMTDDVFKFDKAITSRLELVSKVGFAIYHATFCESFRSSCFRICLKILLKI